MERFIGGIMWPRVAVALVALLGIGLGLGAARYAALADGTMRDALTRLDAAKAGDARALDAASARLASLQTALSGQSSAAETQLDAVRRQLSASDALIQASGNGSEITVVGQGDVLTTPDILDLSAGVSVERPSTREAMDAASAATSRIVSAIRRQGVAGEDIQTQGIGLYENYDYQNHRVTDYVAFNTVKVRVRNLGRASDVINAAVDAGGNDARVYTDGFDVSNPAAQLAPARSRAMRDAHDRAAAYAAAGGRKLGEVLSVKELYGSLGQFQTGNQGGGYAALPAAGSPDVPIQAGQAQGVLVIQVTYRLD